MKSYIHFLAAALCFAACNNDSEVFQLPEEAPSDAVSFYMTPFETEDGSRTDYNVSSSGVSITWAQGDVLGVFPGTGNQTAFNISAGAGSNYAVFDGQDWRLRENAQYAAYFPLQHNFDLDKSHIEVSYAGQTQNGNGSTAHLGQYDFMYSNFITTNDNGNCNFNMQHLGALARFQLTMPEADTFTSFKLTTSTGEFTKTAYYGLTETGSSLTKLTGNSSITLSLSNIATTAANQVITLYTMMAPGDYSAATWTLEVTGNNGNYTQTMTGKNVQSGKAFGVNQATSSSSSTHEYVDLGLPSGTLWATCNVGASSPEEYGDYFAWGETTPQASNQYDWASYKWMQSGYSGWTGCTKYTFADDKTSGCWYSNGTYVGTTVDGVNYQDLRKLQAADDAATANWGTGWCMPTFAQIYELFNESYTTKEWTTKSGVYGYKITSNSNGNSIFLPTAGHRIESSLYVAGTQGYYWSSELRLDASYDAYGFFISSYGITTNFIRGRSEGQSVRAVRKTSASDPNLLPGQFSVSATKKVQFTKSNLYWDGSEFKFEAKQTDYPTEWNANHVGHFYWTKTAAKSYAALNLDGDRTTSDIFFCSENLLFNIEGTSGLYALSKDEWNYLITSRSNAVNLRKYGVTVSTSVNCLIIAPDGYTGTLKQNYSLDEIAALGFVCLSAAGGRDGYNLISGGIYNYCWSSSPDSGDSDFAYVIFFNSSFIDVCEFNRNYGFSLRLVKTVE